MKSINQASTSLALALTLVLSLAAPVLADFWMKFTLSAAPNQSAASTRIFVSITNTSSKEISFGVSFLCRLTDLIVTDAHGTVVPQDKRSDACKTMPSGVQASTISNPGATTAPSMMRNTASNWLHGDIPICRPERTPSVPYLVARVSQQPLTRQTRIYPRCQM